MEVFSYKDNNSVFSGLDASAVLATLGLGIVYAF